jgi:hypothetical protein
MDFIWDGNHNLAHKTAWWWDGLPNGDPSTTQVNWMCYMECGGCWYSFAKATVH